MVKVFKVLRTRNLDTGVIDMTHSQWSVHCGQVDSLTIKENIFLNSKEKFEYPCVQLVW